MSSTRILRSSSLFFPIPNLFRTPRVPKSYHQRLPTPPATRSITTIPSCPSPTCACQDMPSGLDIERDKPLDGTMAAYHEHVMISTGRTDWTSRIEEDPKLPFIRQLKDALGQKGKYANPYHNVMITTSSATTSTPETALLFPSFKRISSLSSDSASFINLIEGTILPSKPRSNTTSSLPESATAHLQRKPELAKQLQIEEINNVHILICGHGERDSRCGILGPILQKEFEEKLQSSKYRLKSQSDSRSTASTQCEISQISHIGGHKFAGNVIIYVPPVLEKQGHPLAGKGVWYGRVEPKHVEGIVRKTIEEGVVIKELFRGGIDREANMMRI